MSRRPIDEQHLLSLRTHVAHKVAQRVIKDAQRTPHGVLSNVDFILARAGSERNRCEALLRQVAGKINELLVDLGKEKTGKRGEFLFALGRGPPYRESDAWALILLASSPHLLHKAVVLLNIRFLGRIETIEMDNNPDSNSWIGHITDIGSHEHDKSLLWSIVGSRSHVLDPELPPNGAKSIEELTALARTRFERTSPAEALRELQDRDEKKDWTERPIVLVDIRTASQRAKHGVIPNAALHVERVELEYSFDPRSKGRLTVANRYDLRIILFDQEGQASSLAAATLHDLGLLNATDIIGGFAAWKAAGLPTRRDFSRCDFLVFT